MYLLDTCALLMLGGRQEDLPQKVVTLLENHPHALYVSTITAFEIVLKHSLGKLLLPIPPDQWYRKAVELYAIEELDVNSRIAMTSAALPFIHKDPCDRFIIATANECKMIIITADRIIPKYPNIKVIW